VRCSSPSARSSGQGRVNTVHLVSLSLRACCPSSLESTYVKEEEEVEEEEVEEEEEEEEEEDNSVCTLRANSHVMPGERPSR